MYYTLNSITISFGSFIKSCFIQTSRITKRNDIYERSAAYAAPYLIKQMKDANGNSSKSPHSKTNAFLVNEMRTIWYNVKGTSQMFDLSIPFPSRNFLVLRALSGTSIYRSAFQATRGASAAYRETAKSDAHSTQHTAHCKYLLCDENTHSTFLKAEPFRNENHRRDISEEMLFI